MTATAKLQPARRTGRLFVELAASDKDVREAQALRYRVFAGEMGARLKREASGQDEDEFDPHCRHLLVRDRDNGRVVGCTRLLSSESASRIGRFYSEGEFDLGPILGLPGRLLEVGRTCIDPAYRQGSAIAVLWSGLAGFINLHGIDYLFGCASIPLGENDLQAAAVMNRLRSQAMARAGIRVIPRVPLGRSLGVDTNLFAPLPALLKAYVRLGAKACGEPCRDPDFNVADVLMLLDMDELDASYARHFIDRAATA